MKNVPTDGNTYIAIVGEAANFERVVCSTGLSTAGGWLGDGRRALRRRRNATRDTDRLGLGRLGGLVVAKLYIGARRLGTIAVVAWSGYGDRAIAAMVDRISIQTGGAVGNGRDGGGN